MMMMMKPITWVIMEMHVPERRLKKLTASRYSHSHQQPSYPLMKIWKNESRAAAHMNGYYTFEVLSGNISPVSERE